MKAKLTTETLLNKKFTPAEKGYEPLEVDEYFDSIIEDYKAYEGELALLTSKCDNQAQDIGELKKTIRELELEIAEMKKQYETYAKSGNVSQDNVKLLRKIDVYERTLWKKGIDPKKLLSDPDNC